MTIVLPHTLANGTNADATQVNDNFAAMVAALESIGSAASGTDVYQAGVVAAADWLPGVGSVNGATGVLSFTTFGGAAWLPAVAGGLARTFTAAATVGGLKPPVLPGPSAFVNVGVELTVAGAGSTVSVVSGVEKASEAEAVAAPPAVSAGKVCVRDVIVKNTAGVFSIVSERDRRPWARGAVSQRVLAAGLETSSATGVLVPELTTRIEAAGVPLRLTLAGTYLNLEAPSKAVVTVAGTTTTTFSVRLFTQTTLAIGAALVDGSFVVVPVAGSQLVTVTLFAAVAGHAVELTKGTELLVEELRPSANNGTA